MTINESKDFSLQTNYRSYKNARWWVYTNCKILKKNHECLYYKV